MSDKKLMAQQINRFFQIMAQQMSLDEKTTMEIADLYEPWEANKLYHVGKIVKHGKNADGETQLYSVLQEHTSQEIWTPNSATSLFKAIGFTEDGVSVWTQPLGADDAYKLGDVVSHKDQIWECTETDANGNNIWEPGAYGWKVRE